MAWRNSLPKLKIPSYIFICDSREDTRRAFKHVLEEKAGSRVLLLTSSQPGHEITWLSGLLDSVNVTIEHEKVDTDDSGAVRKVLASIKERRSSVCIGIGGGRILDVAKYASFSSGIPFISFPTLLSHDGIASPVAVIHDGKHWSESRTAASPFGVIVDLETVSGAPASSMLSGVGDLTANLFASLDAERFRRENNGEPDELAVTIARSASHLVFPGFQSFSANALSRAQIRHLAWGLVLSGIAMAIAGSSRPASGAEHKISHAIDYLFPVPFSHGFTVSAGNVVSAFLHDRYREEIVSFNASLGLPVTGDDIGIDKKDFSKAILHASTVRPDRYTILEERHLARKEVEKLLEEIAATKERLISEG